LAKLKAVSESEESVHVVDEEFPLDVEGILSFCCLSFKVGDLLFFDFLRKVTKTCSMNMWHSQQILYSVSTSLDYIEVGREP